MRIHLKFSHPTLLVDKGNSIKKVCDGFRAIDSDFPYLDYDEKAKGWIAKAGTICPKCNGLVYENPHLDPHSIQGIFRTYGGWQVKVRRWAPDLSCGIFDNIVDFCDTEADREYMEAICKLSDATEVQQVSYETQSETSTPENGESFGVPPPTEWQENAY